MVLQVICYFMPHLVVRTMSYFHRRPNFLLLRPKHVTAWVGWKRKEVVLFWLLLEYGLVCWFGVCAFFLGGGGAGGGSAGGSITPFYMAENILAK